LYQPGIALVKSKTMPGVNLPAPGHIIGCEFIYRISAKIAVIGFVAIHFFCVKQT